jgi:hypothetical protein
MLRFDGGVCREPAIDAWFRSHASELDSLARPWFERMRNCGDDVRELLHDYHPTVCVEDAAFAYVNVFTSHVNVGFFHGVALDDPKRLLVGAGKRMRHVKLRPGVEIDTDALGALIRAAYVDIKARLRAARAG